MKASVIYDSVFGNTEKVAQAIGAALGDDVPVVKVGDVTPEQVTGLDVLIVGSPTRAFSMTPATKAMIKALPAKGLAGVKVAAFDTRMDIKTVDNKVLTAMAGVFGFAAEPIAKLLKRKGGVEAGEPGGFIVLGTEGPLLEGELERAAAWASQVVA